MITVREMSGKCQGILTKPVAMKRNPVWARITKFAPNVHPGIPLAGIENEGH